MRPRSAGRSPTIMSNDVVLPAPFGPSRPTTSPRWMSSETSSTTFRRLNHLDRPCATSPSISVLALGLRRRLRAVLRLLFLGVEDRFHALLLAALDHAALLVD